MKPKQRNWTDEDDQYLKEHWFEPLNKIGEKFNVTGTAIRYRLEKKLGIERPKGKIANMRLRASIYRDRNKDKVPEDWMELPSTRQDAKKINRPKADGTYRAPKAVADALGHTLDNHLLSYARFQTKELANQFDETTLLVKVAA